MTSTFDCCSPLAGKLHSGPSFLLINPFHVREFRVFRRRRLKHYRHAHRRTAFTVRSQSNPFESLFHNLVSQVTTVNSLELIAPALGFSSGVALYLSNVVSAKNSAVSDIGEWILLSSPTPFNRFVFLRCPSIAFPRSDTNLVEDVSEKLVKEDRHFVRLNSGRMKATTGDDDKEDKLTYQRLCISTEDGGVISLDWPSNLNLREDHGLDTTLLLVPGTPEGSMDKNVRLSVIEALGRGLFPIVMNPRGCAGSPLTTARYDHCLVTSLLHFVINMSDCWKAAANTLCFDRFCYCNSAVINISVAAWFCHFKPVYVNVSVALARCFWFMLQFLYDGKACSRC